LLLEGENGGWIINFLFNANTLLNIVGCK